MVRRALPLIDSIPYVTQWISNHPQGSNREAILLPNIKTGKAIQVNAIFRVYKNYRKYFTSLLSSENVPEEEKYKGIDKNLGIPTSIAILQLQKNLAF